jgi:hypothetical protein
MSRDVGARRAAPIVHRFFAPIMDIMTIQQLRARAGHANSALGPVPRRAAARPGALTVAAG